MKKKLKNKDGLIFASDIFRSMTNKDVFCFFKTRPHPVAQTSLKLTSSQSYCLSLYPSTGIKAWTTKPGQDNLSLTDLSTHTSHSLFECFLVLTGILVSAVLLTVLLGKAADCQSCRPCLLCPCSLCGCGASLLFQEAHQSELDSRTDIVFKQERRLEPRFLECWLEQVCRRRVLYSFRTSNPFASLPSSDFFLLKSILLSKFLRIIHSEYEADMQGFMYVYTLR